MALKNADEYFKLQAAKKEMEAGITAAKQLQGAIRAEISTETVKRTGAMMRSKVQAFKSKTSGLLDRITISSPHYSFKLNYGFEGTKSNGISMSLKPTNHLYSAIEKTSILNKLATEISEIRANEVLAQINF